MIGQHCRPALPPSGGRVLFAAGSFITLPGCPRPPPLNFALLTVWTRLSNGLVVHESDRQLAGRTIKDIYLMYNKKEISFFNS